MRKRLAIGGVWLALLLGAGVADAVSISSVGSGYWTNPASWNPAQVPAGTDDVIIATGSTNTISTNEVIHVGSLTVQANATLTHLANGTTAQGERYKVVLSVSNNLTIDLDGQINVDGRGYSANNGPGKPAVSFAGGSYGGKGGQRFSTPSSIGTTYGSIIAPTNLGSGGSIYSGGGCVQLTITGTTTVNGAISAMGAGGGNYEGGSGGSVFLTTGALSGNGTLKANGGSVLFGSSGGGGRIAVVLTNSMDFGEVKFQAYTGTGAGTTAGAGGTVYLEHTNHPPGQGKLIVDYNGIRAYLGNTLQNGKEASSYLFSEIVLTNAAVYELDTDDTLSIVGTAISGGSASRYEGIHVAGGTLTIPPAFVFSNYFIRIGAASSTFLPTASLTVGTNATMRFDVPWTVDYPITLAAGGWLSHSANAASEACKLNLTLKAGLNIQTGGQVNVDGMGYSSFVGPGAPTGLAAGSHGGRGGSRGGTPGTTYGSITAPTNLGSRGAVYAGGGCAQLVVTGTTTVHGAISAQGGGGGNYDGGSGGSVFLITDTLVGNGTISANGGNVVAGSSGGGGRVAVILTNSIDFGEVRFRAYAGSGPATWGAAGTVYLATQYQEPGGGLLLIDASNIVSAVTTMISSNVTDTIVGTVIVTNRAKVQIDTNQSLTVNGSWTNAATFMANSNSTVIFTSTNTATIMGNNAFYNLTAGAAGKTIRFEAGKTNAVNGTLVFQKDTTLLSTVDGVQWWLNLSSSTGTQNVGRVMVKDSNASPGQQIRAGAGSRDLRNNVNWWFPPAGAVFVIH